MNQFTAAVSTAVPSTRPSQRNRWAATSPGWIGPIGESIGSVATATSWVVRSSGSMGMPKVSAIIRTDWPKPRPRTVAITLVFASPGVAPNSITSRTTSGAS